MSMRQHKFLVFRVYRFHDTTAYGKLYDYYFMRIRRYIYFKVPKAEDADELTADVFLRGWEYATSSRVDNPGALFYRIARNLIADFYRRRKEEMSLDAVPEFVLTEESTIVEDLAVQEEHAALVVQIRKLKEEYQEVLVMRYMDDLDIREIAVVLEKTPNNVRVTLHRAKKALQELIKS